MARTQRLTRFFTLLPFLFLFFASGTSANTAPVLVTVWDMQGFNASPPLPTGEPVGEYVTDVVWHNFDAQPVMGLYEDFVVRFQGTITTDVDVEVLFYAPADDGVLLYVSDQLVIDDWVDKGGGGSISSPVLFTAGVSQSFTLWFYENGGGAWVQLWWNRDGIWEPVPASVFTGQTTTTSTSAPTTTLPETTTTEPQTTTTFSVPESTTTLTPTTVLPATTIQTSTTTSSLVPVDSSSSSQVQVQTSLPAQTFQPVPVPTSVAVPTTSDAVTVPTQLPEPQQEIPTQSSLPPTEEYQSATIVNGGVIGKGLKPVALISNGLREDVTPAQQRMVVAASVLIAMPSPVGAARRKA